MSEQAQSPSYDNDNIIAKIIRGEIPCHKVYEDDKTLAFMDIMPQATGHVLIVPKTAAVELSDLPIEDAAAVMTTAKKVMQAQREVFNRTGIVQLQLNSAEAGQSIFHYHMHLIPTNVHELGKHASTSADHGALSDIAAKLSAAIQA
ncbi:HIT family protein [Psychrobacter aestuarii]|uniref:HIT family protein n=1 Tax=Psychrobacter aestuarii TaxID=556327 RepID=A0ABN0W109_9GAMM|nr:HIT domain-containing protein [Psychrobacter aestuarii]